MNKNFFVSYAVWGLFFGLYLIVFSMFGKANPSVVTMTATIKGTWDFDVDTGQNTGWMADFFWDQVTETERHMVPRNGVKYANLGIVDFDSVVNFSSYSMSEDIIDGSVDHNAIPDGTVLAIKTDIGNYAKMRIDNSSYNLNVTIVVYRNPVTTIPVLHIIYYQTLWFIPAILITFLLFERKPSTFEEKFLHPLDGEHFIMDVSPTPSFKRYVMVNVMLHGLPLLAMFNVMIAMVIYLGTGGAPISEVSMVPLLQTYAILYLFFAATVIGLTFILANLMYNKYHYWVTDRRVIWKHGIIGYSITSVPLEKISDVAVSRTFLETTCGVGGLIIKEMMGEVRYGWYGPSGRVFPTMIAVPNPEEMQRQILEFIGKKGEENKLTV